MGLIAVAVGSIIKNDESTLRKLCRVRYLRKTVDSTEKKDNIYIVWCIFSNIRHIVLGTKNIFELCFTKPFFENAIIIWGYIYFKIILLLIYK